MLEGELVDNDNSGAILSALEELLAEVKALRAELATKASGEIHYHYSQPAIQSGPVYPAWPGPTVTYCGGNIA
jgi:hypothetical protein